MNIIIENKSIMIEDADFCIAFISFIKEQKEIFFNDWVPTGEKTPNDFVCANIWDGRIRV